MNGCLKAALIVGGVVVVGGILLIIALVVWGGNATGQIPDNPPTDAQGNYVPPGLDSHFDDLWGMCDVGDMQACDELFEQSEIGSEYEDFGGTCGYRLETIEYCVEVYPDGPS